MPTNQTAIKSIFGCLEYVSHCLPTFKLIGMPLMDIVKEGLNSEFTPSDIHYRSWEMLPKLFDIVPSIDCSVDIVNLSKNCYLVSDASLYGCGACILQLDKNQNLSICSWMSKKFTPDISYHKSSVTLEAIGLLYAIEFFKLEKW